MKTVMCDVLKTGVRNANERYWKIQIRMLYLKVFVNMIDRFPKTQ